VKIKKEKTNLKTKRFGTPAKNNDKEVGIKGRWKGRPREEMGYNSCNLICFTL